MSRPRALGVLLCYNDGDVLADVIRHLLDNEHDVIAWDHGSTDETAAVLDTFARDLREVRRVSRSVDFYDLYALMSKHLLEHYVRHYDWISWPDQDEILEAPTRGQSYYDFLIELYESPHDWVDFRDFVFWFTDRDDAGVAAPTRRIRHYCRAPMMPAKVRCWRASATNIRWFNHNPARGTEYPSRPNLRHYPMRSAAQMRRRILVDRAGLQKGPVNYHYEHMKQGLADLAVRADQLHHDDGTSELNHEVIFDWATVYGERRALPDPVWHSWILSTRQWLTTSLVAEGLAKVTAPRHRARIDRWGDTLHGKSESVLAILESSRAMVVTEDLARQWDGATPLTADAVDTASFTAHTADGPLPVSIAANAPQGAIRVTVERGPKHRVLPLVALVREGASGPATVVGFERGVAEFTGLAPAHYVLAFEPPGPPPAPTSPLTRLVAAGRDLLARARERIAPPG